MTLAAHALQKKGKIAGEELLPSTIEDGTKTFQNLVYHKPMEGKKEAAHGEPVWSGLTRYPGPTGV